MGIIFDAALSAGGNVVFSAALSSELTGGFEVIASNPNTTDDASLWTGLVDTATGDPITIVDGDKAYVTDPNNLGNLAVQPDGTISADTTGDFAVRIWLASEGVWGSEQTVTFTSTSEAPQVPQFAPTIGQITKDTNSGDIPFTYPGDDATGFEHSTDGGTTWGAVTSPVSRTGLNPETLYNGQIRAVNAEGAGGIATYGFITSAEATPGEDNWPFSRQVSHVAPKAWTWGNRHPKTGMRTRIYK